MNEDTERLDWMAKQLEQYAGKQHYIDFPIRVGSLGIYLWGYDPQPTLRAAIDAAMHES